MSLAITVRMNAVRETENDNRLGRGCYCFCDPVRPRASRAGAEVDRTGARDKAAENHDFQDSHGNPSNMVVVRARRGPECRPNRILRQQKDRRFMERVSEL